MPFLTVDQGALQTRISSDAGDIELAGPDLQGNPLANVLKYRHKNRNSRLIVKLLFVCGV